MRVVAAGIRALRPFSRSWFVLCAVALLLTFGLGGGTPNSPTWLAVKFLLLGVLLASLLVTLALQLWDGLMRSPPNGSS
jgi:hypothetical protein